MKRSPNRLVLIDEEFPTIKIHSGDKKIKNEQRILRIKDIEKINNE